MGEPLFVPSSGLKIRKHRGAFRSRLGICGNKTPLQGIGITYIYIQARLEYTDEGTLDDLLQSGEVIDVDLKMKLGHDVVLGLMTLHDCGLVHCDLKANNVFLFRSDPQIRVAN
jgi:serine/threonine protein kinase